jgi:hypothetical protein
MELISPHIIWTCEVEELFDRTFGLEIEIDAVFWLSNASAAETEQKNTANCRGVK